MVSDKTHTDLAVTSLLRTFGAGLKRRQTVKLTSRDRDLFLSVLDRAEPPNRALRKAARRFRRECDGDRRQRPDCGRPNG